MRSFVNDVLTVLLPKRRHARKNREKAYRLLENLIAEYRSLAELPKACCSIDNLRRWDASAFDAFLSQPERGNEWTELKGRLDAVSIPELTGAVNPGDQRLIFNLIRYLQPRKVLEVGTHVGGSTLHIATSLQFSASSEPCTLTTVDISRRQRHRDQTLVELWLRPFAKRDVKDGGCGWTCDLSCVRFRRIHEGVQRDL